MTAAAPGGSGWRCHPSHDRCLPGRAPLRRSDVSLAERAGAAGHAAQRAAAAAAWRASAATRALPDFLIVGAQKAGTTSLYDTLCAGPQVRPARKKEVRFLTRHWDRGVLWYRWSFPTRASLALARRSGPCITGEADPDCLVHPLAPSRAAAVVPEARLVVVLREPVARAHSQYRMNLALGVEDRPFEQAIEDELVALERRAPGDVAWGPERNAHSYVERGRYHPQLVRWLEHFPRQQLHVSTLGSLVADPVGGLGEVHRFLGIDPPAPGVAFAGSNRRDYEGLPDAVRRRVAGLFADDRRRTEALLGMAIDHDPEG